MAHLYSCDLTTANSPSGISSSETEIYEMNVGHFHPSLVKRSRFSVFECVHFITASHTHPPPTLGRWWDGKINAKSSGWKHAKNEVHRQVVSSGGLQETWTTRAAHSGYQTVTFNSVQSSKHKGNKDHWGKKNHGYFKSNREDVSSLLVLNTSHSQLILLNSLPRGMIMIGAKWVQCDLMPPVPAQANINNTAQQGMLVERLHLWLENKQKKWGLCQWPSLLSSVSPG